MTPLSTSSFYERSKFMLADLRGQADRLQAVISGGSRLSRSSDDPVAAARLRSLAQATSVQKVNSANADHATADLTLVDASLGSFADLVGRAREMAAQAANGTLDNTQRAAIGTELTAIHDSMFALSNARDSRGHALFGGEATGDAYTKDTNGNAVYSGTVLRPNLDLGDGINIAPTLTGPEFLNVPANSGSTDTMAVVKQLADSLISGIGSPQVMAQNALTRFDASTNAIATAQAVVGSRLSWIDVTVQRQQEIADLRDNEASTLNGGDLASNIVDLQNIMTVLQASQASFARLSSLSLFDVLR